MPKISQIDEVPCQAEVRILQKITFKCEMKAKGNRTRGNPSKQHTNEENDPQKSKPGIKN